MRTRTVLPVCTLLALAAAAQTSAQTAHPPFTSLDVFQVEYASDVQIAPDGRRVAYVRNAMSIMRDRREGRLWIVNADGSGHRKLTSADRSESSPRWSPDGTRIAFVSGGDDGAEIYVYWVETGESARLTQLERSPGGIAWSPDGTQIAFSMLVPEAAPRLASMPPKPAGAEWAAPPRVTTRVRHERDGSGFIEPGFNHIFVVPADGGTPRQVTSGDFQHRGPVWMPDGGSILFSANREPDWEYALRESEVYRVGLDGGEITRLTDRNGPDASPAVAPDGQTVAYVGFDDRVQTYQTSDLYLMRPDGSRVRTLLDEFDRSVGSPVWASDGSGIYLGFDDEGITKVGFAGTGGSFRVVAEGLGGTAVGRPYGGGNFSVARDGTVAFTRTSSTDPSEVALVEPGGAVRVLTSLNADLRSQRHLAEAEMFWTESSYDGRRIQSWVVYPPGFDRGKRYPLLLEIHGGPVSNYGDRFSAEVQLYAAAGYVVLYSNPRGSTGYGEEFGNLLYHDYPGNDYDDLMSAVDAVIERGYVDPDQLYVTGGSAGGIMTAWIVGKTDRFRAAVATKPVVNWISKTLVADNYNGYANYRYPGQPWENPMDYWRFSPLSLVENVSTPTMVMVGMADLRTPVSEAKQLYHALKLRRIDTALVEIPGSYHNISNRPSQLIAKVLNTLAWFERYR
ncbi:MAG: prolyl oligopeptidase family serine peptidase [Longimicrobiales bacterium]